MHSCSVFFIPLLLFLRCGYDLFSSLLLPDVFCRIPFHFLFVLVTVLDGYRDDDALLFTMPF